jgi:hypothetical protein
MRIFLLALLTLAIATPAYAGRAETMLIPTRVIIKPEDRYATLVLKNTGDATGQYEISLVEMKMGEDGSILEIEQGQPAEYPASTFTHIAPRSVTVAPDASQTIRLLVRRPEGQEPGEYRSHIKVRVVNDNVEGAGQEQPESGSITVKANLVLVIPLIVRTGEGSVSASLADVKLAREAEGGQQYIEMYIGREGNRSVMGDIKILQGSGSELKEVAALDGVPVYRPTARRLVKVPLDKPLAPGPVIVRYQLQAAEGGTVLAETTLNR